MWNQAAALTLGLTLTLSSLVGVIASLNVDSGVFLSGRQVSFGLSKSVEFLNFTLSTSASSLDLDSILSYYEVADGNLTGQAEREPGLGSSFGSLPGHGGCSSLQQEVIPPTSQLYPIRPQFDTLFLIIMTVIGCLCLSTLQSE